MPFGAPDFSDPASILSLGSIEAKKKLDLKKAVEKPKSIAPEPQPNEPKSEPKQVIATENKQTAQAPAPAQQPAPAVPPKEKSELDKARDEWLSSRDRYFKMKGEQK